MWVEICSPGAWLWAAWDRKSLFLSPLAFFCWEETSSRGHGWDPPTLHLVFPDSPRVPMTGLGVSCQLWRGADSCSQTPCTAGSQGFWSVSGIGEAVPCRPTGPPWGDPWETVASVKADREPRPPRPLGTSADITCQSCGQEILNSSPTLMPSSLSGSQFPPR